jgi:FkbH-like protein
MTKIETSATPNPVRQEFVAALQGGRVHEAMAVARDLLAEDNSVRTARFIRSQIERLPPIAGLRPLKVALLSSFSIEFIHDFLVARGFANGVAISLYQPGFNQVRQEIADMRSGLYAAKPDVTVIAVEGMDWVPALYGGYVDTAEHARSAMSEAQSELAALLAAYRERSPSRVLLHNFAPPAELALGILDTRLGEGQAALIHELNAGTRRLAFDMADVHLVDYAGLVAKHGARRWYDRRMALYARAPIAQSMLGELAVEYMKYIRAFYGLNKKCLVVDLDNTLWGGVLGEDGVDGIKLGPEYPGSAFVEFQRDISDLSRRGVILAIASKNNREDVEEAFAKHKHMILKLDDFAEAQIHWREKSQSIKAIAERLNIGLEHIVMVDDNPVECAEIRRALPMVTVIELPERPEDFSMRLAGEGLFDALALSAEDRNRAQLYRQRAGAEDLRTQATNIEDFYRSLDMTIYLDRITPQVLPRAAQLTQKTNQFNTTTRRYSADQVKALCDDPGWVTATFGVRDRFGDNGVVGLAMARADDASMEIDTFLMSCRVINRTVETAMLAHICDEARARGLSKVVGRLIPTPKNLPVRDLFERHGFRQVAVEANDVTVWTLDLADAQVHWPEWFRIDRPGMGEPARNLAS